MSRMSRSRWLVVGIGVLALLLALAPLVPRGADEDASLRPAGDDGRLRSANAVGASRLTAPVRAEIDRVVAAGRRLAPADTKAGAARATARAVRCAELEGQRYCLGIGWTEDSQTEVRDRVVAAARTAPEPAREQTGDLDATAALRRTLRMDRAQRAAAERAELTAAARSVAKVWLLRHEIQGTPLPDDFLARHPEARAPATASARTAARTKTASDYPRRSTVLHGRDAREQRRTYWCGPTTMQAIASGWHGEARRQRYWAHRLGTTRSGTAITDIVRVVNHATGYDLPRRAGRYITLDVGDWSYPQWRLLMMRHIHDYQAPVVLHPVLRRRYFSYLDDDASGHFQVGRGYDKNRRGPLLLGYLEPWNQQRFDPSEPFIHRVQWRGAYKSYRANQAHPMHNVGV